MGEHSQDRYLHALNPDMKAKSGRINLTFRCSTGKIEPPVYSTPAPTVVPPVASSTTSPTVSSVATITPSKTVVAKKTKAKSAAVVEDD
jgi:hypothetical protein